MRWFPRFRTAREVGEELIRGLGDGSIQLGAERWVRLEATLPEAAEVRRELVGSQEAVSVTFARLARSVGLDYVRAVVVALASAALIGMGLWLGSWFGVVLSGLGSVTGVDAAITFTRARRDHTKVAAIARWLEALQGYIDWPSSETESALRVRSAESIGLIAESDLSPSSLEAPLARLPSTHLVDAN